MLPNVCYRSGKHATSRGSERIPYLLEVVEGYLSESKPGALFFYACEACRSVNSAHSLLSLSLSLSKLYYLLLRKQPWQRSAKAAFCLFSGMAKPAAVFLTSPVSGHHFDIV